MGDSRTSLVNTRIALVDAPEAARSLYRRLVDLGAIEPQLRDWVPRSLGWVFPICGGFADFFEAGIEAQYRPCIYGVEIKVTGHVWRNDGSGGANIFRDKDGGNGLFFNYEGSFAVTCRACGRSVVFGEECSQFIYDGLDKWRAAPETASMTCPQCISVAPIRDWRSATDTFATGHLGFTLWGGQVTALFEKPSPPAGTRLRHLIGDFAEDYAVVFCHI
jgi:hypothetical protein